MDVEIKANIFTGIFFALFGLIVLAAFFTACMHVEELPPPKPADMAVELDSGLNG